MASVWARVCADTRAFTPFGYLLFIMDIEKKDKIKRIFKRIYVAITSIISVIFVICVVVACSQGNKKQNNNVQVACAESEVIDIRYDNKKFVSYNDESYEISLSVQELNTYSFESLYEWVTTDTNVMDCKLIYEGVNYNASSNNEWTGSNGIIQISSISYMFQFKTVGGSFGNFTNPMIFKGNASNYATIKALIEEVLPSDEGNINDGIFETLTESTVSFIGSLNSGIQEMTAVFYDSANNNLTTIGLLSVIVVAVSLCYWLFRLIIGLIRMRG